MTTNLSRRIISNAAIITTSVTSRGAAQAPPPINYSFNNPIGITLAMIIIFLSIVTMFFLMGCLSVYARRWVEYRGAANTAPASTDAAFTPRSSYSGEGLDSAVIASFPAFVYSEVKKLKIGKGTLECAICLSEFEDTDTLRLLPKCCHVFHQDCIDTWLNANVTCPVCRDTLVPRPDETINFVLPATTDNTNSYHTTGDDIIIDVQSPGLANSCQTPHQTPQQFVPTRSASRKSRLFGKFKRSFTTGDVAVRPVKPNDDYVRFTLRLPDEVRSMLVSRSLGQEKSEVVFPRVGSKRNGYRSASVGANKGRSLMNYERVEPEGHPDRWRFTRTLSNFSRIGSVRSPNWIGGDSRAQHMGDASKSLSKSVKSSFQFGVDDSIKVDVIVGERSFDRLKFDGDQV